MVFNPNIDAFNDLHSGTLLVATPALKDPNFAKSIVLLSSYDEQEGSLGVVINKPLDKKLGDFVDEFQYTPLSDIGLYLGGPVQQNQLILAGWKWSESLTDFRLYFGISHEKAIDLLESEDNVEIRGYLGYAGWSDGQLEGEINENAWYKTPVDPVSLMEARSPIALWRELVRRFDPMFDGGILDIPDDPSLN